MYVKISVTFANKSFLFRIRGVKFMSIIMQDSNILWLDELTIWAEKSVGKMTDSTSIYFNDSYSNLTP